MVRRNYVGLKGVILAASLAFGTGVRADEQVVVDLLYAGPASREEVSTPAYDLDAALSGAYAASTTGAVDVSLGPSIDSITTPDPAAEAEARIVDEYMAKAAAEVTSSAVSPLEQAVSPAPSSGLVDKLNQIRDRKALRPAPVALFTGDAKEELDASSADAAYRGNQ